MGALPGLVQDPMNSVDSLNGLTHLTEAQGSVSGEGCLLADPQDQRHPDILPLPTQHCAHLKPGSHLL